MARKKSKNNDGKKETKEINKNEIIKETEEIEENKEVNELEEVEETEEVNETENVEETEEVNESDEEVETVEEKETEEENEPEENKAEETEEINKEEKTNKKSHKGLKIFLIIIIILIIIIGGSFIGGLSYIKSKLIKIQQADISIDELELNTELKGYRNIALFGVDDSGDSNLGKNNRSDCIIIASINENTKDVKLISVYRDSYLEIEGYGLDKVTNAYSYGDAQLAIKTLNKNLDLNIKEYVTVNFSTLAEAIDSLGGIEIEIDSTELKYINDYINSHALNTGKSAQNITKTGIQTLSGTQAVAYSRIRYTEAEKDKKTEPIRDVITAMLNKLKTKSPVEINNFMDEILPKVYTNMTPNSILVMIPDLFKYNIDESIGWPYKTQGITLDRWYGIPVTLENNVKELHVKVFNDENYEIPEDVKEISDKIIDKTGYNE